MKHQPGVRQGQVTTPEYPCPTLCGKCVGSLASSVHEGTLKMQKTGSTVYSPYPRKLERRAILQMSLQRLHNLVSCFKTLNVNPIWDSNSRPLAMKAIGQHFFAVILVHNGRHTRGD